MNKNEWTFFHIPLANYHINQKNNINSYWICPWCDNETLNLETQICNCWYNVEHKTFKIKKDVKKTVENNLKPKIWERFCGCWEKIIWDYPMCRNCYWKSRI